MAVLVFVIPVRHQANARNWPRLKQVLSQTARSIANQDCPDWKAVVVANNGADIPVLPKGFEVCRVDLPPNPRYTLSAKTPKQDRELVYEAVRKDKGKRILAGMLLLADDASHFMMVDDDDFVSRRLASFVGAHANDNGWYIGDGYVWTEGSRIVFHHSSLSVICGTTHIVRSDLFRLPASVDTADNTYVQQLLGSHAFLADYLARCGTPLAPLPFSGAVYRTGHAEAHSRSRGIVRQHVFNGMNLKNPYKLLQSISRLELCTDRLRTEFGMQSDSSSNTTDNSSAKAAAAAH